jgi:2-oxoglutarate dehydrogenase E1 component
LTINKPSFKRYSIEGGETMLILLAKIFGWSSEKGIKEVVFATPHRGRLNVLC